MGGNPEAYGPVREARQSRVKLSRLETGHRRPDLVDIMTLLDVHEVTGPDRDALLDLAQDAATREWWHRFGKSITPHDQRIR